VHIHAHPLSLTIIYSGGIYSWIHILIDHFRIHFKDRTWVKALNNNLINLSFISDLLFFLYRNIDLVLYGVYVFAEKCLPSTHWTCGVNEKTV